MGSTFKKKPTPASPATPPNLAETANNVYQMTSKDALVKFLHQCLFSPPKRTLVKALDNQQLPTWPLTKEAVVKYLPDHSPATDKGSMKRQRKGLRSTKVSPREILKRRLNEIEIKSDFHPPRENAEHNQLFT
jgi:hypothetical protein